MPRARHRHRGRVPSPRGRGGASRRSRRAPRPVADPGADRAGRHDGRGLRPGAQRPGLAGPGAAGRARGASRPPPRRGPSPRCRGRRRVAAARPAPDRGCRGPAPLRPRPALRAGAVAAARSGLWPPSRAPGAPGRSPLLLGRARFPRSDRAAIGRDRRRARPHGGDRPPARTGRARRLRPAAHPAPGRWGGSDPGDRPVAAGAQPGAHRRPDRAAARTARRRPRCRVRLRDGGPRRHLRRADGRETGQSRRIGRGGACGEPRRHHRPAHRPAASAPRPARKPRARTGRGHRLVGRPAPALPGHPPGAAARALRPQRGRAGRLRHGAGRAAPPLPLAGAGIPGRPRRGAERIAPEWWREQAEPRDYYRIECEAGRRLWLYRDGPHGPERPAAWFVHGMFP